MTQGKSVKTERNSVNPRTKFFHQRTRNIGTSFSWFDDRKIRRAGYIFETPCVQSHYSFEGRNLGHAHRKQRRTNEWKRRRCGSKGTGRRNECRTSGTKMKLRFFAPSSIASVSLSTTISTTFLCLSNARTLQEKRNIDQDGDIKVERRCTTRITCATFSS